jgi:hypothetical protein
VDITPILRRRNKPLVRLLSFATHHHQHWHDSPVWALALLRTVLHLSLFDDTLLQVLMPKILMSYHTYSSHLNLGLPTFLFPSGFVLNTSLIILLSLCLLLLCSVIPQVCCNKNEDSKPQCVWYTTYMPFHFPEKVNLCSHKLQCM